jgi:ATP-binding cassette subfamily C protein CydC
MRDLLRPRLSRLVLAVGFGVLSLGGALALAGVSAWLITRAWQMPPVLDLSVAVVAVRALSITRGVFGYCERLASHDVALRAAADTRERIYRRLARGPVDAVFRRHTGDVVNDLGASVDEMADAVVRAVIPIAVAAILGAAAVLTIAAISPGTAVVLAIGLLVAGALAPYLSARAAVAAERTAVHHHSRRDGAAMLALSHALELRVGGRLDDVVAEADRRQREWGRALDRAAAPAAVASAAPTAALGATVLSAAIAGILLSTSVAPTTVAVLMLLPLSAFEATTALPGAAVQLVRSRIAAQRLHRLLAAGDAGPQRPTVPVPRLDRGDRLVVTGPSGCGKTTLLMTLAGLWPTETAADAAFFPEDGHLFATTVRDNLLVARGDATDDELRNVLCRIGLGDWLDRLPDGLSTVLTGGAAAVSAGQRRRLLLARAMLSPATTVLLDEPTEHLDAADGARLLTTLLATPGGLFPADRTVVIATHHLPDGLRCRTLDLSPGRVTSPA